MVVMAAAHDLAAVPPPVRRAFTHELHLDTPHQHDRQQLLKEGLQRAFGGAESESESDLSALLARATAGGSLAQSRVALLGSVSPGRVSRGDRLWLGIGRGQQRQDTAYHAPLCTDRRDELRVPRPRLSRDGGPDPRGGCGCHRRQHPVDDRRGRGKGGDSAAAGAAEEEVRRGAA